MGSICSNKLVVQAALEGTYGVDPGTGYVPILVNTDSTITPAGDEIVRDTIKSHISPSASVITRKRFDISINMELKGGGITGGVLDAPESDLLLRACYLDNQDGQYVSYGSLVGAFQVGETVTITGGAAGAAGTVIEDVNGVLYLVGGTEPIANLDALTGVISGATAAATANAKTTYTYVPVSDCVLGESISIRFNYSGVRYVATGVRGSAAFDTSSGDYPKITFTFQGIYATPTDQAIPSADFSNIVPPRCSAMTFRVGSLATLDPVKIAFDLGNPIEARDSVRSSDGIKSFGLGDGVRNARGTFDPEMLTLAEYNPFSYWEGSTLLPISAQVGTASGNTIRFTWPRAQHIEIPTGKRAGVMIYNVGFLATGSDTGNDEFYLSILET